MLRSTTASVLTVVPATKPKMNDGSDGSATLFPLAPPFRPAPQPHLAARAEVRRAAADDDAGDRAAAAGAVLPLAGVDEELVLHRPFLATGVAIVVDRGAAGVDPNLESGDDGVAQRLEVLGLHRA